LPDLFRAAPALSDGIAQEEDVHVPLLGAFDEAVVQVNPPLVLASGRVDGRVSWLRVLGAYEVRADEGGAGSQRENDATTHQHHEALLRFGWRTQTVDRLATGWVRAARYRNPGALACPRSGLRKTKRPTDVRPWARVKIVEKWRTWLPLPRAFPLPSSPCRPRACQCQPSARTADRGCP